MSDLKKVIINGEEWEGEDIYCQICGAHMGGLCNFESGEFKNPHNYEEFGHNKCPKCGQKYEYLEADRIVLSEEQLKLLRKHAGLEE